MHASRLAVIFVECYGEGPSRPVMTLGGTSDPCASVELYNISDGAKINFPFPRASTCENRQLKSSLHKLSLTKKKYKN